MNQATVPTRMIVIDSQVSNWQRLASDVSADTLVLILDSSSDGMTQISDYLTTLSANTGAEGFAPLQSLHIISHGSSGSLLLGSSRLTSSNLSLYSEQLATLGNALSENGDILLYGCNVAAEPAGLQFIKQFADLTNADVAASNDITGSAALGGDWLLEAATGTFESSLALSAVGLNTFTDILVDSTSLPIISLSPLYPSVTEGNSGTRVLTMTATLSFTATSTVTVNYATSDLYGTSDLNATAGLDYVAANGVLTFAAGETSKTFDIVVNGDTIYENNEYLTVNLSSPSGAVLSTSGGSSVWATITNDDTSPLPIISLSPPNQSVTEGNSGTSVIKMTATLSFAAASTITVNYATSDITATAGSDYVATNGVLTFAAGETVKTFDIVVNGDTTYENNEWLFIRLTSPTGAVLSTSGGSGVSAIITNDDTSSLPIISLSPLSPSVTEGNLGTSVFTMTATLSFAATSTVTVNYATSDLYGTSDLNATAGSDYVAANGVLTFAAGETTKTFDIVVNGDTTYENNEYLTVNLSAPSGAVLSTSGGSGVWATIMNDDTSTLPIINLSPLYQNVKEGNSGTSVIRMTATLSLAATSSVTVNYATSDITATAGSDYVAINGVLTFAAGETSKTFDIFVNGDTIYEGNESLFVRLSSPSGAVLSTSGGSGASVIITNDDDTLTIVPSVLAGTHGNDTLMGTTADEVINGSFGFDTVRESGVLTDYAISQSGNSVVLTNSLTGARDVLTDIERVNFESGNNLTIAYTEAEAAARHLMTTWLHRDLSIDEGAYVLQHLTHSSATDIANLFLTLPEASGLTNKSAAELLAGYESDPLMQRLSALREVTGGDSNDRGTLPFGVAVDIDGGQGHDVLNLLENRADIGVIANGGILELIAPCRRRHAGFKECRNDCAG